MNQKILSKILATMLVVTLTFANFILLGVYATNSYATDDSLENQTITTNNENVEFDAYFKTEGTNNKVHTTKYNFEDETQKLYLAVQVKKGYLKDSKIQITGENNTQSNLELVTNNQVLETVEKIDTLNKEITLKQVNSGTQIVLEIPIKAVKQENYDLSNFSKINDIKLTGTYVGNDGKTISISKTIKTRNEWTNEMQTTLEQQITKFIPYEVEENIGTILQTTIKTGLEKNSLPIKETTLKIKVPTINGKQPETISVTSNGTKATNGQEGNKFTNEQWSYDKDTQTITIIVKNTATDNKVSWVKDVTDEYVVTYNYAEKIEQIQAEQTAELNITAYSSVEAKQDKQNNLPINLTEKIGEIVTTTLSTEEAISKGILYNNSEREISYQNNTEIDITDLNLIDEIVINQNIDNFVDEHGNIYPTNAYYKTTKISKENFEQILGEKGSIGIYTNDGQQIAILDSTTATNENGEYAFTYTTEVKQIKIKISKPVANGKLKIENVKNLEGKSDYSKTQITKFKTIELKAQTETYLNNVNTSTQNTNKTINLVDPTTQIEVSTSTNTLSTVVENKNVELRVILKTNDISYDLYKNPVVQIELPSYIEKFDIKDINLLFDNELKIQEYKTTTNSNGNLVLTVKITGEDTKYSQDEISKGANLVVNANITLKELTPTKQGAMKVYVTNENAVNYENTKSTTVNAYAEIALNSVAPIGIVTTNTIENYNTNGEKATSISGEQETGKLEIKTEAKNATIKMNIINNYNNKIKNIAVLGRIPFEGNKNTNTNEDLGSNLTTTLNNLITATGIDQNKLTVYYTTNKEATKDLSNTNNGWTTTPTDITAIKSYLIVLNDYEMSTGDVIEFSYGITIPENLSHNLSTYAIYTVYFDNIQENETMTEKATATKVGLTTGQGAELEVSILSTDKTVEEGKKTTYNVIVKNIGKVDANNVIVNATAKQAGMTNYTKEEELGTIKAGEEKEIKFDVRADAMSLDAETENLDFSVEVKADNLEKEEKQTNTSVQVIGGYLNLEISTDILSNIQTKKENDEFSYILYFENVNRIEKENVVIKNEIPEGLIFKSATPEATYDENTRTVTWNIGTLKAFERKNVQLTVTVDTLKENETEKTIKNKMLVETKDKQMETEEISIEVKKPKLTVVQTSETESTIGVGDIITYHVTIKNEGAGTASNIKVEDNIPEGLKYKEAQYSIGEKTYTTNIGNNKAVISIPSLNANDSIDITIKMQAKELEENETEKEVINVVKVTSKETTEITSNEIKHKITLKNSSSNDPSVGEVEKDTYLISGSVWLDKNADGKKDSDEECLPGITVTLINAENGKIVTDTITGIKKEQQTNENGKYTFGNLKSGKYMVIFQYDTNYYGVTIYKAPGINSDQNSDVILANAIINGETKKVGTTDKIEISIENKENIDMGLVVNPQFDLKLDKVITSITTQQGNKTKTYEYKDSKFAKLDLDKKVINNTTILIEYKIRVTNEGDIAGYAKKIVDYIPQDMKFSSELNPTWYQSTTGNIYNASLANTLILPGETKELTLLLTKKMSDSNLGLINNTAEICESYNDLGISDIDSTPANKVQTEDDISTADAMLGVKTGEVYMYITITLICVGILGVGIYLINKKVLRRI